MHIKNLSLTIAAALTAVTMLSAAAQTDDSAAEQATTSGSADRLVLVEQGVSRAPIIVYENMPPRTRRAADELAEYIEKISGARPEIIEGAPESIPEHAIWVGVQPKVKELFPDIDFEFEHPEAILIAANEEHLVIAGRDRWDLDTLVVAGPEGERVEGFQREYGTANAVYTFLQEYLDVMWLWPGELGEDIIQRDTIALDLPFETHRYHPQFRQRRTLFRLSKLGDARGQSHEWARHQRLQLDSLMMRGGHAFTDWWERFHETNRDLFAVQPDGDRSGWPGPHRVKLDLSNPEVWNQWLADVEATIREKPHKLVFNATENDSANKGLCVCEQCRAWDPAAGATDMFTYRWESGTDKRVALSDRYATFTNHVARMLQDRFPDRDFYVGQFAYHQSSPAPVNVRDLEDNIIMSYIGYFPFTTPEARQQEKREFYEWSRIAPNLIYRPNFWVYYGSLQLPQIATRTTIEDWRFLAENNCIGIFIDTAWENWATMGPQYYLMAQLTWNPYQDGQAVLEEYYERGFGPAAPLIEAYWNLMEREVDGLDYRARIGEVLEDRFSDEFLERAEGQLRLAARRVEDGPQKYQERVAFVRAGLEFTRLMLELVPLMERADNGDDEALSKAKDHWDRIEQIAADHPYALWYEHLRIKANQRDRHLYPEEDEGDQDDQRRELLPP